MSQREEISRGLKAGESLRSIANQIGRCPSSVSREVARHGGRQGYRAWVAQDQAQQRRRRPRPSKLSLCEPLHKQVQDLLEQGWSPERIAKRLRQDWPDNPEMWGSHQTIYKGLHGGALANQRSH